MARLNEPVLSTAESIELLRKKMLRQNRELAKTNNIRALNIRDLENELDRAVSENFKLRARIAELEKQAQGHESRRSHSMEIRKALEGQLAEWCTLLGGLGGMDPPAKQPSPPAESATGSRRSYLNTRISPSQRRLRNIANDVEQLGHIAEHKYSRKSLSPEQIEALICDIDDEEAMELPPPTRVVHEESAKSDTPPREARARNFSSGLDSSPLVVSSPNLDNLRIGSVLPASSTTLMIRESRARVDATPDTPIARPIKAGTKRKFSRDEYQPMALENITDENMPPGAQADGLTLFEKTRGKTVKELAAIRREHMRSQVDVTESTSRMPLATKSTNDDVQSPKKRRTTSTVDTALPKPRRRAGLESFDRFIKARPERARAQEAERIKALAEADRLAATTETGLVADAETRLATAGVRENVRDTTPPTSTGSLGETSRPSRRSRAAISYTEPNLRDKMRRPRNETFDAVSGEGKSRRFSHSELPTVDIKRESGGSESWRAFLPPVQQGDSQVSTESTPVSPRLHHSSLPHEQLSVYALRQQRMLQEAGIELKQKAPVSPRGRHSSLPYELPSVYAARQERLLQEAGIERKENAPVSPRLRHSSLPNDLPSVHAARQERLRQEAGIEHKENTPVSPRLRYSSLPHELPSTVQADRQLRSSHLQAAPVREENAPVSPRLRHSSLPHELPSTVQADRQLRSSRLQAAPVREESDVYEFTSSSPYTDGSSGHSVTTRSGRRTTATRRFSTKDDDDNSIDTRYERIMTRRRSMMV